MSTDEERLPATVNEAACRLAELDLGNRDELLASVEALREALAELDAGEQAVAELARCTDGLETALDADTDGREQAVRAVAVALDALMRWIAGEDQDDEDPAGDPLADAAGGSGEFVLVPETAARDMLGEFVDESRELLEECEEAMLRLEHDPADAESVNTVFRGFHTIKGTAACLGLGGISHFAHRAESLLSRVRDGELRFGGGVAELSLLSRDALKQMTDGVARVMRGETADPPANLAGLLTALESPGEYASSTAAAPSPDRKDEGPTRQSPGEGNATESVRVRTDRLDRLVDMVGELVVAHSMVDEQVGSLPAQYQELTRRMQDATKIVRELRDLGLSLRMVPLRGVFRKLQRTVRDVTQRIGKQVDFVTEGEDTEIDRNMVDLIADPLVHMVRNAVDHGIESGPDRVAAGKPETGKVRLSAHHAGGNVVLRLEDDGRGLDRDRILRRAVERGMVAEDAELSDAAVFDLLFQAGFSTAEKVTDVSGRGVGLDVVRRRIEALQGRVEIASTPGRGTVFGIKLPLTLAIADGMQVRCGGQRFIVPTVNIHMSLRPETPLQTVQGHGELLRLRDQLLPVFRLGKLFGIPEAEDDPRRGLLVVLDDGDDRFALLVDELLSQQQVVVKPLNASVGKVPGVSGAAVLGDGTVGLILEPGELAGLGRQDAPPIPAA